MSDICPVCAYPLMEAETRKLPGGNGNEPIAGCAHPNGPHYSFNGAFGRQFDADLTNEQAKKVKDSKAADDKKLADAEAQAAAKADHAANSKK